MNQFNTLESFLLNKSEDVAQTQVAIVNAGKRFLQRPSPLDSKIAQHAASCLDEMDIYEFISVIRPEAAKFVAAKRSSVFWDMVDAVNFFMDAVGTQWKYMTEAKRAQSLKWAADHASLI